MPTTRSCPPGSELQAYAVGKLSPERQELVAGHIENCSECKTKLQAFKSGGDVAFDPYHKWLGIAPKDQPPTHYKLLGIDLFESDREVIQGAVMRQSAHVRTFQMGQHSADSQRILNEISAAKVCLLDAEKKNLYDVRLREQLQTVKKASESPETEMQSTALPGDKKVDAENATATQLPVAMKLPDIAEEPAGPASPEKTEAEPPKAESVAPDLAGMAAELRSKAKTSALRERPVVRAKAGNARKYPWWKRLTPVHWTLAAATAAMLLLLGIFALNFQTSDGSVTIKLSDPPADVSVKVDDDVIAVDGLKVPIRLKAGDHKLLVEAGGFTTQKQSFTIDANKSTVLTVSLEPKPAPSGTAKIELSHPKANVQVFVDGGNKINTNRLKKPLKLAVGEHRLLVQSNDFENVTQLFTVTDGGNSVVHVELKPKSKPAPSGTVRIELSDPKANVQVSVDSGDKINSDGLMEPLKLMAGRHVLVMQSENFESVRTLFDVADGSETVVSVKLNPKWKPAPSGTVRIELSDPEANVQVSVDSGNMINADGLKEPLKLTAGKHTLVTQSEDFETFRTLFDVTDGGESVVVVKLIPKKPDRPVHTPESGQKKPSVAIAGHFSGITRDNSTKRTITEDWDFRPDNSLWKNNSKVATWKADGTKVSVEPSVKTFHPMVLLRKTNGKVFWYVGSYKSKQGSLSFELHPIYVVAIWQHQPANGQAENVTYWSNGHVNTPDGDDLWATKGLQLNVHGKNWSYNCTISQDRQSYEGTNNMRQHVSGKLISGPQAHNP